MFFVARFTLILSVVVISSVFFVNVALTKSLLLLLGIMSSLIGKSSGIFVNECGLVLAKPIFSFSGKSSSCGNKNLFT